MKWTCLHNWDCQPKEAAKLQKELAPRVITDCPLSKVRHIAAVDVSHNRGDSLLHAGAVIYEMATHSVVERVSATLRIDFPYISGFLSFRELPPLLRALSKVQTPCQIVLCDGQGIAHPRGLGIASHLGLWLNLPTIGCAKSLLFGRCEEPDWERGSQMPLYAQKSDQLLGSTVRTRSRVKPVYVSPGHLCDVKSATDLVLQLSGITRLPTPSQLVHRYVNEVRLNFASS